MGASAIALFGSEFGALGAGSAVAGGAEAVGTGIATGLAGSLVANALTHRAGINIPPPPGAAMIDPAGSTAAAQIRQRQAIAGGLGSTNIPGANSQAAFGTATSGSKSSLGQ